MMMRLSRMRRIAMTISITMIMVVITDVGCNLFRRLRVLTVCLALLHSGCFRLRII